MPDFKWVKDFPIETVEKTKKLARKGVQTTACRHMTVKLVKTQNIVSTVKY